jgi:hypothetical protein
MCATTEPATRTPITTASHLHQTLALPTAQFRVEGTGDKGKDDKEKRKYAGREFATRVIRTSRVSYEEPWGDEGREKRTSWVIEGRMRLKNGLMMARAGTGTERDILEPTVRWVGVRAREKLRMMRTGR